MTENLKVIRRLLNEAKRKAKAYEEAENAIFAQLEAMGIDPTETPTNTLCGAYLADAITQWLSYGDNVDLNSLMSEIKGAMESGTEWQDLRRTPRRP